MLKDLLDLPLRMAIVLAAMLFGYVAPVTVLHFPYDVGLVTLPPVEQEVEAKSYYDKVYGGDASGDEDTEYVVTNRAAAHDQGIGKTLGAFAEQYGLEDARTLEVGAGSGTLQDVVEDYTGLDIADNAARYFHKPFVQGSATELPFEDDSFDVAWTVWTLEHVPDPEKAMHELRRVVKPGGMIFFYPAFNCTSWAAHGYEIRPYDSLTFTQKLEKATLAIRANQLFRLSYIAPIRAIRHKYWEMTGEPTRLRYTAIAPNYTNYWVPDADATASIDTVESMIWFESRGDECLNCPDSLRSLMMMPHQPLHIKVNKE